MDAAGSSLPTLAERWVGRRVSEQIVRHHRRRLHRIGQLDALDPPAGGWAAGDPSPRPGNAVEVLVDGAEALPAIAEAIRAARSHVHLAGWHFAPDFALERDGEPTVLRNLLAETAERVDVRVLAWAGAPLPLFRPSRREVRRIREQLVAGTRIRCELDARERPLHCHHEKVVLVDDEVAFVGGIDLTWESGDRFDTSLHAPRANVGWHDLCTRLHGPAVADVAEHFRLRWREVAGEELAPPVVQPPAGDVEVQVARTVPERVYRALPRGQFRILESYLRALRGAERLVYLENQFLWSPEIEAVLADKLARPPHPDFRLVLLLPADPNNGADDTRGTIAALVEADDGAGRLAASTLYARAGRLADPVYVHAKLGIVDDRWLTIGSANLNEHSLFNDTELNVVVHDPELARRTRLRLWSEHLELAPDALPDDPVRTIDEHWKPIAAEQLRRREAGEPLTHRLVRLPGVSRRSRRLLGPLDGLLVDG